MRDAIVSAEGDDLDVLYADELLGDGRPFFKPGWSPERLRGQHLLAGLTMYRSSLVAQCLGRLGDPAGESEAAQLHDLALVATELASAVGHLPIVGCHRRSGVRRSLSPAVVQRHMDRIGLPALAVAGDQAEVVAFEPDLGSDPPLVSIVMPTGGTVRRVRGRDLVLVDHAIESLLARATYPNYEIVVVVDQKSTAELAARISALSAERIRVVKDERPFNFAAAANLGVANAAGSMILLLNDDTEVVQPGFIERLVVHATQDDVGAVGAKLFYGDGRIQHAGVLIRRGTPDHSYHGYPGDELGHGDALALTINASATTGACMVIRRDHWDAVGGMSEDFPLNYNDVDLCLKLLAHGWRTVVDNTTTLTHLETSSRPRGSETWEDETFRARWPAVVEPDPFDSPNFVALGMEHIPKPLALVRLVQRAGPPPRVRAWCVPSGTGAPP